MANPWPNPGVGQTLDNYGIWTDSGLILDLMVYILIFHFLVHYLGQRLEINWTTQILDSSLIYENSAWAPVTLSQYLDKIWTG